MLIARMALGFAFVTLAAAGCGATPKPPATDPTPVTDPAPVTMDLTKLGAACGDDDGCEVGSCAKYYGIAGPSGPEFSSCEIACDTKPGCPDGTECATIADGPGAVCRPPTIEG